MPGYYSKKPVVIRAMQFDGSIESRRAIIEWAATSATPAHVYEDELYIKTLESGQGAHHVSRGDWVICGVKGEFYACKPDIFEQSYQEERGYPYDRPDGSNSALCRQEVPVEELEALAKGWDNWADTHLDGIELEIAVKCHRDLCALLERHKQQEGGK